MPSLPPYTDWAVFVCAIAVAMALDAFVRARENETVTLREATYRSILWLTLGIGFTAWITRTRGVNVGLSYLTAYLVEKSLSIDNLFVFLVIFRHFAITARQQARVLFWGVLGAVVLRAVFIVAGTAVLHQFSWSFYAFGAFLAFTGIRLARGGDKKIDPEGSLGFAIARRTLRLCPTFDGTKFFTRINGKYFATPLCLVLLVVELSDVVFAVDSVPAVLGISSDLYVVYTSNIMAILGLRALYFLVSGMMGRFHKLDWALSAVLIFVGAKMLAHDFMKLPNWVSLLVIAVLLTAGIIASLLLPTEEESPDLD